MIRQLGRDCAVGLSAAQVITSVSAAVKELIENAFDASCHQVTIRLVSYGMECIDVEDDGTGIGEPNGLLACRVSSKSQNLESPQSYGFRGEALHAMAATSDVTIESLPELGDAIAVAPNGAVTRGRRTQRGTRVTVRRLLQSVAVRRRHLQRFPKKQRQQVLLILRALAFARFDVRLIATHQEDETAAAVPLVSTTGTGDMERCLTEILGAKVQSMEYVEWSSGERHVVVGFVSKVGMGQATSDAQFVILNNRVVELPSLTKVISDAFASAHPAAASRLTPCMALHIRVDHLIDVNLSPDKRQVFWGEEEALIAMVREHATRHFQLSSCKASVGAITAVVRSRPVAEGSTPIWNAGTIPHSCGKNERIAEGRRVDDETVAQCEDDSLMGARHSVALAVDFPSECLHHHAEISPRIPLKRKRHEELSDAKVVLEKSALADAQVICQFNMGFIIVRIGGALYVVDQHAADEKHTYEQLQSTFVAKPQRLVCPAVVRVDDVEKEQALKQSDVLAAHGFIVSEDSGGLLVSSVPILPYDVVKPQDVVELTRQLCENGAIMCPLEAVRHSLATKACRTSVMIGSALDRASMRRIVHRLAGLQEPWHCPHGRPTLMKLGDVDAL